MTNPTPRTARWIGALFLGAILAYGTGSALTSSVLGAEDPLAGVGANSLSFTIGALLILVNSAIVAGIGILFFPVLSRVSPAVALTYFGARMVESIVLVFGVVSLLSLVAISGQYLEADAAGATSLEALGVVALGSSGIAYQLAMAALGLGSLFFCAALYRSRLVPRFLAGWGFIGYAVFLVGAVLEVLGFTGVGLPLSVPGGLFEMIVGVWLIVKGFGVAGFSTRNAGDTASASDSENTVLA